MTVDRTDAVPLYHQIFLTLRDEILRGERPLGSLMPTEYELIDAFSVSRITARRALDELAASGYVKRRRRVGTEVVYRSPAGPIDADINQAVEALIAFGHDTEVRVIEHVTEPVEASIAARLQLEPGDEVVRSVRMRLQNGAPLGLVVSYLPAALASIATEDSLTSVPMLELLRDAGAQIGGASQTIEAMLASVEFADTLQIDARAPLLRIERLVEDVAGKPILLTVAHYRADRYRVTLNLHQTNGSGATFDHSTTQSSSKASTLSSE